jgi:hypothetical protein
VGIPFLSFDNKATNTPIRGGEEVMIDCGGIDASGPFDVS